ncbi:MAG: ABC transporter substrate-binding protein, partial [Chloroflexi bacterium]|nr:ABC transporter substrate-binding protein [Chloroflexota bacterium]
MKSSALHVLIRLLAVILVALTPAEALAAPGMARRPAGPPDAQLELRADTFGLPLRQDAVTALYAKPAVYLQRGEALRVRFSVAAAGDYVLHLDMVAGQALISTPEGELTIDGDPLPEAPRVVFPVYYENSAATFPLNRYGNETL